jgi:hypothetical protein
VIFLRYNKLRNIKSLIGVWLGVDSVAALIYLIAAISGGSNVLISLIVAVGLIFIPGVMYLLADAVLDGFLTGGYIRTNTRSSKQNKIETNMKVGLKPKTDKQEELKEYVPKTRYEDDIIIDKKNIKPKEYAFHKEIKTVIINDSVSKIGKQAFYGCDGLEKLKIMHNRVIEVDEQAFDKVKEDLKIYVHPDFLEDYMANEGWEPYIQHIYPYKN